MVVYVHIVPQISLLKGVLTLFRISESMCALEVISKVPNSIGSHWFPSPAPEVGAAQKLPNPLVPVGSRALPQR